MGPTPDYTDAEMGPQRRGLDSALMSLLPMVRYGVSGRGELLDAIDRVERACEAMVVALACVPVVPAARGEGDTSR